MKSINSNVSLSKKSIIAQVIQQMTTEIDFIKKEMDQFDHLSVKYRNNSLSQEKLIMRLTNLYDGSFIYFVDIAAGLGFIGAIIN